eukprot:769122-Amorphochlora_amoeboformis.AAC.1
MGTIPVEILRQGLGKARANIAPIIRALDDGVGVKYILMVGTCERARSEVDSCTWGFTICQKDTFGGKERKNDGVKDSTRAPNFGQKVDQIKDYGFRRLGLPSYLWTKMDGMNISSPTLIQ